LPETSEGKAAKLLQALRLGLPQAATVAAANQVTGPAALTPRSRSIGGNELCRETVEPVLVARIAQRRALLA
jgi:hypothetical protein